MKQFNRTSKPDAIKYGKKEYTYFSGTTLIRHIVEAYCKSHNLKMVQVNVLSRRLKGVTDLHGNPYKPSAFIYTHPATSEAQQSELSEIILQCREFQKEMASY